jgi:hypothetical protein
MKTLVTVVLTLCLAVPITATAALKARTYYLKLGETAVPDHDATACTVVRLRSGPGFRCKVGGDYRGPWGVAINSYEVALLRYTGFNRHRVVLRRSQVR